VKGDIEAERIVAGGRVEGKIVATGILDVQATAAIQGELTTPSLQIADGAQVVGRVEMPARRRHAPALPIAV
jgi:cytoskeletal protein CcmA (bactofilin family)